MSEPLRDPLRDDEDAEPRASPSGFSPPLEIAGGLDGREVDPSEILVVRRGPGANCSSIGSVLDVLFLSAAFGGALLVAVAASLSDRPKPPPREREHDGPADEHPAHDEEKEPDASAR